MRALPLNTVLNTKRLFPPKRDLSPPSIKLTEEELSRPKEELILTNDKITNNFSMLNGHRPETSTTLDKNDEKGKNKVPTIISTHFDSSKNFNKNTVNLPPKLRRICSSNNSFTPKKVSYYQINLFNLFLFY